MIEWYQIYTTGDCKWCVKVKDLMKVYGIDFYEKRIDENAHYLAEWKDRGFKTVPQVLRNDTVIGGFEKTRDYLREDFFGDLHHRKKAEIFKELQELDEFLRKLEEGNNEDNDT